MRSEPFLILTNPHSESKRILALRDIFRLLITVDFFEKVEVVANEFLRDECKNVIFVI